MTKPVIGILGSLFIMEGGMFPGLERAYVNNDYVEAVEKAGGVPLIIPVAFDESVIENQIKNMDGVILTGGYDVDPQSYGEEPRQKLGFIYPQVDEYHLKAIEYSKKYRKPLMGICRGMQIINVAFGGTLYQDLTYADGCFVQHWQNSKRDAPGHSVEIMEDSSLFEILGGKITTNSFHHQCVHKIAPGFKIAAIAKDGIIEAIESRDENFILGIQWHPEMMALNSEAMLNIFRLLINITEKERVQAQ